jgi:hydrogenase maturation protease
MTMYHDIRRIIQEGACLVGIGNTLCSDDAAGVVIAGALTEHCLNTDCEVIIAEDIIESYSFSIAKKNHINVLLLDAVEAPHAPGSIIFGKFSDMASGVVNFSTHKLSLALAVDIMERSGKTVYLLGIVPSSVDFGNSMSDAVVKSTEQIIQTLSECLKHYQKEHVYER